MIPPPTPVPRVIMITSLYPLPQPNLTSPNVATFASLLILVSKPHTLSKIFATGRRFHLKLPEKSHVPSIELIDPGHPTPIPNVFSFKT